MERIGIICEYNPFHNGHIYHINKIKELYPDSEIILVMSSSFTERGEISILNKWEKTEIALNHNIDLVLELPYPFSTESADTFAYGSIRILSYFHITKLIFGSEEEDINNLINLVDTQLNNPNYDNIVKEYLDLGYNYPTSMSKALYDLTEYKIINPNDLLGLSYIKQIKLQNLDIEPISIKRNNDYHSSGEEIRNNLFNSNLYNLVPEDTYNYLNKLNKDYKDNYFKLLKYKIISDIDNLDKYMDVVEGIENRIKKYIIKSNSLDELIEFIKTKRYTYNKLNRMFNHILTGYTKEMSNNFKSINYIRVLGFNKKGSNLIKKIREEDLIPIITNYSDIEDKMLNFELRISFIYSEIMNNKELNLIELKSIPIKK